MPPKLFLSLACGLLLLSSCSDSRSSGSKGGPIVLGDSATIVTEEDARYTRDMVADLHPDIPSKTPVDEDEPAANPAKETTELKQEQVAAPAAAPATAQGNGLNIPFKDLAVAIPGITVKSYRNQDPAKGNGVSYQMMTGSLPGNRIMINSGNVVKVSQRYQSELAVAGPAGNLMLDNMTTTTDWVPLMGSRNTYTIAGLDARHLEAPDFTPVSLKNAIAKAARRHRISRAREQEYQSSVRTLRTNVQKPLSVVLHSVMWKIDYKDSKGKALQKQVRIDVPVM